MVFVGDQNTISVSYEQSKKLMVFVGDQNTIGHHIVGIKNR